MQITPEAAYTLPENFPKEFGSLLYVFQGNIKVNDEIELSKGKVYLFRMKTYTSPQTVMPNLYYLLPIHRLLIMPKECTAETKTHLIYYENQYQYF